jgi:hypothetical protein
MSPKLLLLCDGVYVSLWFRLTRIAALSGSANKNLGQQGADLQCCFPPAVCRNAGANRRNSRLGGLMLDEIRIVLDIKV